MIRGTLKSCVLMFLTVLVAVGGQTQNQGSGTSLEDLFAQPVVREMKMSPDGKYLVGLGPFAFQFMDANTLEMSSSAISVDMEKRESLRELHWVNDERVLYTVNSHFGQASNVWWPNNFYSVNFDGKRHSEPFNRSADEPFKQLRFIGANPENSRTVFMQEKDFRNFREIAESTPVIVELEIYSKKKGKRRNRQPGPLSFGDLHVDRNGLARVATGVQQGIPVMHYRASKGAEWKNISEASGIDTFGRTARFIGFHANNKSFYVIGNHENGIKNVYLFTPDDNKYEKMYGDDMFDVSEGSEVWSADGTHLIGVHIMDHWSSFRPLVSDNKSVQYLMTIARNESFRGERLSIAGMSRDGNMMLILQDSSTNPGTYWRFDVPNRKLDIVSPKIAEINPADMSITSTHGIKTADGTELFVKITIPKGAEGPVPAVVFPHAGPHGQYDAWGFDPEVQAYALHGYGVVQINYRGSDGRGLDFVASGFGEWGGAIVDDVLAATQYASALTEIDGDRMCISGFHYGAYLAMEASARSPERFKCAIGIQGIYDLSLLWNEGEPAWPMAPGFLDVMIGRDLDGLAAVSPANHAEKIKVPVFLAHGGGDPFAPSQHHSKMLAALKANNADLIEYNKREEGHAFRAPAFKTELYQEIMAFLDKHL